MENENKENIQVSVVGGKFARFKVPFVIPELEHPFVFVKTEENNNPILVKLCGKTDEEAEKTLVSLCQASCEEVIRVVKNMARGFLFENKIEDIRIVETKADLKEGKMWFKFTAEKRYKLSKLLPKLAKIVHMFIEFEQVGARDYARELGGLGRCGLIVCCKTWLKEIPSVTLDMARAQYVFASPDALTGICGRLLCCMRFELPVYEKLSENYPKIGDRIKTPRGFGKITEINVFKEHYRVLYDDGYEEVIAHNQRW